MVTESKRTGRWAIWIGAAAFTAAAVLALQLHTAVDRVEHTDQPMVRDHTRDVGASARNIAAAPALAAPARAVDAVEAEDGELAALAGLPPEDVEWVLDRVDRTQSVRALSAAERLQLMSELASIRMFAVLERTEDMTPSEEVMP